ncbi:hypothetical protein G9A89_010607 [Geosiphon pyriformis]|nr:hypothetical protein G9A89_010607 [Geosiphon pyriformis]
MATSEKSHAMTYSSKYAFLTSGLPRQEDESKWRYHLRKLVTLKKFSDLEKDQERSQLKKTLGPWDLISLGIGGIIGTGIFVLTGEAAATKAGPAVVISFLISGFAASFAALSYSEMASMIPVAGSAYTYAYATMGELMAWIIGWDLILEYAVAASAVAVGKDAFGIEFSPAWTKAPILFNTTTQAIETVEGAYFNVLAFLIVIVLTVILTIGIKESARINTAIVFIKLLVVMLFIIVGSIHVDPKNYKPFIPKNEGRFEAFGVTGIFSAASVVFFAYIGFDSVSTTAQECRNPQRDLPIGILGSLTICTLLYMAVCLVLTGLVPYNTIDINAPIASAISVTGMKWLVVIIDLGALAGLTSVILCLLLGQPRIFFSMAQDGLFPAIAAKVHPRFQTPYITTAITGIACAIIAALLPIEILAELTSVGTLFAFFLVNIGVLILRFKAPDVPRRFRVPGGPFFVPIVGALFSILLLATATRASIERLFIWMAIGILIYVFYGRRYSKINKSHQKEFEKDPVIHPGDSTSPEDDQKGIDKSAPEAEAVV